MLFQCLSEARLAGVHEVRLLVPMSFDASTAVLVSRSKPLVVVWYAWAVSGVLVPSHVEEPLERVSSQLREEKHSHCNGRR